MSKTKLEPELRQEVIDRHRDRRGRIICAGWPKGSCGRVVEVGGFEIDHIVPETDSTPELRTEPANLQVLCKPTGKENREEGCHRRKTRHEARQRAKANRTPRQRRSGLIPLAIGLTLLGYVAATLVAGPDAGAAWLVFCLQMAGVSLVTFVAVSVYIAFRERAPREDEKPQPEPKAAAGPTSRPSADRIKEAFREVAGQKGTVKVEVLSDDRFQIDYPGTGFKDGTGEDSDRDKIVDKMNAKLGDRWRPAWQTDKDRVTFTRRPPLPDKVPHPGFPHPEFPGGRPWHIIPIAPKTHFDLMKTSHVLVVGATNAGKTSLIRAIIAAVADSASRGETEGILFDPKRIELLGFKKGWKGIRGVVTDTWDQWLAIHELREEMEQRYLLLEVKGVPLNTHRRLIVIIDEFEDLVESWHELWLTGVDPETQKPLKKPGQRFAPPLGDVRALLRKARRCGIHLIIGTQSADASNFGGTGARGNLQGRAAVGPINRDQARMAFDDASVGRDLPDGAKGRTTVQVLDGDPEEVQTYWVPDPFDSDGVNTPEDWAILERLGYERQAA